MRTFLTSLIEVSLTMSAVAALLLLLGRVLERRFAPQWRYWAWLVVALRLCVPVNVSLPRAPVVLPAPPLAAVRVERPVAPAAGSPVLTWNTGPQAGEPGPVYRVTPPADLAMDAAGVVEVRRVSADVLLFALWSAGALIFMAVELGSYLAFRRRVGRWSRPAGEFDGLPVRSCDAVDAPLLMGLLRPVILVPAAGAEEFALLHEARHARRRDLWYKLLLVLCNAVHWFNPLVWALRRAAERDVEIACDAALLEGKDEDYRRAYGRALLRTVTAGRKPGGALTSAFAGGKSSLRQRFASLMDASPKRAGRAALGLLCAAALLSGTMVACGGGRGLTVPEEGTVYAKFSPDLLENTGDGYETFTLTVVDYDRGAGTFRSREEVRHTFTLAEEVSVRRDPAGGAETVAAGESGSREREQRLFSVLFWPMLTSVYHEDSAWLLELHLTGGRVDALGWILHSDRFPGGDLYDGESGLYFCPHAGAGTVVPEALREGFSVEHRESGSGEPGAWFYAPAEQAESGEMFWMTRRECGAPGDRDSVKSALCDQWFPADGVQLLDAGAGEVYDPVSGVRLSLPGELTGGLVLISARTGAETGGGSWLVCLHREMLGQISVRQAVANRGGLFALGLVPEAEEPLWAFGWEGRYPWVTLSAGARSQCEALLEVREEVSGSLDTSASALLAQSGVTGVEHLDLLPAEQGTVAYHNDAFGFTVAFPAGTAEHLMAVTTEPGAGEEAVGAGRAVTFVDRRLMARLGAGYAPRALSGGWSGRIVVSMESEASPAGAEEVARSGGFRYCCVPAPLTEAGLALARPPIPEEERAAILRTAAEAEAAARRLTPPLEETRTPLERFVPDGLTALFDGPDGNAPREEEIYWYRLRLQFHFDGTAAVDLEKGPLHYQLEFEEGSPLGGLVGFRPFTSGGRAEPGPDGRSGALDFTTGSNVVTEAGLAQVVARDPACTLRVTDPATGESRTFPLEVRYQGSGGAVYARYASYDGAAGALRYRPIRVDEGDMSFTEPDSPEETAPLAKGVRLIGGYGREGDVQSFLDSLPLFSHSAMGLRLTVAEGEITALEWVRLRPPAGRAAERRTGVVHQVDVEEGTVSGFWLDGDGVLDFDAAFTLPVTEGCNIQLLDGGGRYGGPVDLKALEERIAPLSSWGLACELSALDGALLGIVEAG